MNGAELPCGTVIGVQPADMNYKNKKRKMQEDGKQSPTVNITVADNNKSMDDNVTKSTIVPKKTSENGVAGEDKQQSRTDDDDDDLDDFFASLE